MNPRRILVVDDDAVLLDALSTKLRAAGYEVLLAEDGASAVSAVRQHPLDLILLDILFPPDVGGGPSWDGFLILAWLRRSEEAKNTPVIMISGDENPQVLKRAREAGALGFCPKPISDATLLAAVERALNGACQATP